MFRILLSAFNSALGFVFRSLIVKFAVFFGLLFITTEFIPVLKSIVDKYLFNGDSLNSLPDFIIYFLNLVQFPYGASLVISAYITAFIIRRIPVIG